MDAENEFNPYRSPAARQSSPQAENALPLKYVVPAKWLAFWSFEAAMAVVMMCAPLCQIQLDVGIVSIAGSLVGVGAAFFLLSTSLWAMSATIELDRIGIRRRRFATRIPWSGIASWRYNHRRITELKLANGMRCRVMGPATSVERLKVIANYLDAFGCREEKLEP